nr:ATP-binding protein [Nostoc sp. DedQUE07]MDZ8129743.1 ATP-binding protein [Nostoc sp. DedQUE07]
MYGAATDIHEARVAMEALRESEAKYRSLFQSMDQGYAVVEVLADDNGEWNDFLFLEVNPAFEQQTAVSNAVGRKATEILGTPNPAWAKIYGRVAQTGEPVRVEEKEKTLDRVFDLYAFRLGEAESRCVAVLFTDITERVGVEDERKQHDANLDFLAEVSQDLARLTDIDETMNALGEKIGRHFGLSACAFAELYGSAGIAVIDYNWHRSDVPSLRGTYRMQEFLTPEVMQLCLAGVDIVIRDVFDDPLTDGEQFATLNIGSFLSIPLIRNGEWQFLLVIYRSEPHDWRDDEIELTRELANRIWTRLERARAEVGLRQSEEKYRLLFNSINEGYALCELLYDDDERAIDWKILQVNPAFESLTGLRDVAGKNATQLNQPLNQNWLQTFGTVAQTGESARFEHYIDSVDCWFDILVSRIDEDKYHIVVVFNNITDRKQAQADQIRLIQEQAALQQERQRAESLAELDRAKTLFFSNVSHEFRTPLTLILAPLQDALSDSVNPLTSSQQEQLELAHRNSLRLLKLVNTLLDFSRIEADRLKANYEPTDLSTYTAELASVFRSAIENANLQLVVDCPPLPDPIYVDREMWEKIVLNLLSNALKFTFEGIISVSLKSKANTVELIVSDTGVGIAASELPHLFERFYQVKGAKGRSYEGSGIGLSLVQELVKRHGGAIAVTSAVDQGTTFTVTIPTGIAHLPADQIWVASTLVSSAVTANAFVEEALRWLPEESTEFQLQSLADFSRDLENPSPNLSPTRREALTSPPSLQGKGAGGLGFPLVFPHDVKTQQSSEVQAQSSEVQAQSSEVQAQSSEVQAQSSEVQAQSSEVQAQSSEVRAQSSKVQAQSSKVQAQSSEVQAQSSEVHAQSSKRARILLVDDNADMRGYLRRLLNQYYEVEAVNDGLAAMTAIRRGGDVIYDLVLADVMMPRMDGFELLRSLRASPNTQTIPIILLSARAGEKSRVEGLETGADDYLIKPFSARELLARVNANLQLAQLRREAVYREQVMQAVQTLNDRLEQQVKARTAQLEAINQELEAFSSSVSHDLRTPLRYISSFAERLQGKLNATLVDASSLQSLNIITKSALEAEKMVDDLLEFSRLGQTEIHLTTVNISQLVQQVREQLQPELIGRSLHWEIEPLATVEADPVLLRLVLQNLLSNAVKYTRNNTEAAIKIGRIEQEQEVIFFVRDNGAGFDMKYCDRLFSIFQRLHPQEEFSGTGVGLATVRRIVHRHGGRIWAEGAINQGATFYFSLPKHEAL